MYVLRTVSLRNSWGYVQPSQVVIQVEPEESSERVEEVGRDLGDVVVAEEERRQRLLQVSVIVLG